MYNHFTHETNDVLSHQLIFFLKEPKKNILPMEINLPNKRSDIT